MKIFKKVMLWLVTIFLLLLLVFNVYNFIQLKVLKKDYSTFFGYTILEVVSGSMHPTIKVGDYVIIDTKVNEYQEGDIVTFYDANDSLVTHRLVSIDGDMMTTKGDNNNSKDAPLPVDHLVGKYVMKFNGLGIFMSNLQKPFVSIIIFIIGVLVCILVSTDKDGNPILEEDEKEYQEFLEYKAKQEKINKNSKEIEKVELESKSEKEKKNASQKRKTTEKNSKENTTSVVTKNTKSTSKKSSTPTTTKNKENKKTSSTKAKSLSNKQEKISNKEKKETSAPKKQTTNRKTTKTSSTKKKTINSKV